MEKFFDDLVKDGEFPKSAWFTCVEFECYFRFLPKKHFGNSTFVIANINVKASIRGTGVLKRLMVNLGELAPKYSVTHLKFENVLEQRLIPFLLKNGYAQVNDGFSYIKEL